MNIKLKSDFRDFYDHWFASSGQVFDEVFFRMTQGKTSRRDDFAFMDKHLPVFLPGAKTVTHKSVRDFASDFAQDLWPETYVVVYLDEYAHAGEGKSLMSLEQAVEIYPDCYASLYIVSAKNSGMALSYRNLQIGSRVFTLKYQSKSDWRSNFGDVEIEVCGERKNAAVDTFPLLAIDYIVDPDGASHAMDFNTAPGLKGTGIEVLMTGREVFEEIRGWFEMMRHRTCVNSNVDLALAQ